LTHLDESSHRTFATVFSDATQTETQKEDANGCTSESETKSVQNANTLTIFNGKSPWKITIFMENHHF
jgi:hypothetical protein